MPKLSLVGQTFQLSPRNNTEGGNITETRKVLKEFTEDGTRFYEVLNPTTGLTILAKADTYDALFLRGKQQFKKQFGKGDSVYNQSSINFKIRN